MSAARGCFSGRVDDYVKARPSYPRALLAALHDTCGLGAASVVADLGSGTGLFTRLLLETDATVHAVEPNAEMRAAAEAMLGAEAGFRSVAGSAEATTLPDASVDLVTAAQAFHWFDVERTRAELVRILRASAGETATIALVWNDRELDEDAFHREYEALLVKRCPRYHELQGKADATEKFDALLGVGRPGAPDEKNTPASCDAGVRGTSGAARKEVGGGRGQSRRADRGSQGQPGL